jgi:hypothetical protein
MDDQRSASFNMLGPGVIELSGIPASKYTVYVPDSGGDPSQGTLPKSISIRTASNSTRPQALQSAV